MDTEELAQRIERHALSNHEAQAAAEIVRAFGVLEDAAARGQLFISYYYYSSGRRVNIGLTDDQNEDREGPDLLTAIQEIKAG